MVASALAASSSGQAISVGSQANAILTVTADPGEANRLTIFSDPINLFNDFPFLVDDVGAGVTMSASASCSVNIFPRSRVHCTGRPTGASIGLGEFDDSLDYQLAVPATIDAGKGNDTVTSTLSSARIDINGGKGKDALITGANDDFIDGGPGSDLIDSGSGDDVLIGGPGKDAIIARAGDDTIDVVDGERDTVLNCGLGDDTVRADTIDSVNHFCEHVTRVAAHSAARSVGTFILAPATSSTAAGEPVSLGLTWTHPGRWRDLHTVDVRLQVGASTLGYIRFDQERGTLELAGIAGQHPRASTGRPGTRRVLQTPGVSLLLADSSVHGSGAAGKTVALTLALAFDRRLRQRTVLVAAGATDDRGVTQPFATAGRITVR